MKTRKRANGKRKVSTFNAEAFLNSAGLARTITEFGKKETLFSQGDPCKTIIYIQKGTWATALEQLFMAHLVAVIPRT